MKKGSAADWKTRFHEVILARGKKYFQLGRVKNLVEKDGKYTAVVVGSREYSAYVSKDEAGQIKRMSCNCPYSDGGKPCKHIAALLYEIDHQEILDMPPVDDQQVKADLKKYVGAHIESGGYQYFDRKAIEHSLGATVQIQREAWRLIQWKKVELTSVSQCFYQGVEGTVLEVRGTAEEDGRRFDVILYVSRYRKEEGRCARKI